MKRYLCLGHTSVDVRFLEMDTKSSQVVHHQVIPVKVFIEMPVGYTGPAKGYTVNANFAPMSLEVEPGQWLTIVPEDKLPATALNVTLNTV